MAMSNTESSHSQIESVSDKNTGKILNNENHQLAPDYVLLVPG